MKKLHYLLPLIVFAIFLNSCKKNSTGNKPVTPTTKPKYLTQVIQVTTGPAALGSPVSTSNIYYTYDSKKRLSTIKQSDKSLETYVYKDDGNLFSITNTKGDGTMTGYSEFTYDSGGKLQSYKSQGYRDNAPVSETTFIYVYNGDKVSEIHFDVYYDSFTYDSNGNIIKVYYYGQTSYSSIYTYDNKKNKFINSQFKFPIVTDIERLSPNNRVTSTTEGLSTNDLTTTNYTYDSDGYPTAGTISSDYANSESSKFTYIYSTLE